MDYIKEQKERITKVVKSLYCVESVYFRQLDGDRIRRFVDMDYTGDGKEVLVIEYTPELYACDNYVLDWEYQRPDEIANSVEI
jgi:hypothetical protein